MVALAPPPPARRATGGLLSESGGSVNASLLAFLHRPLLMFLAGVGQQLLLKHQLWMRGILLAMNMT